MDWNGFKGSAIPISEEEIAQAAKALGVKWSRLRGIMEVEASYRRPGNGFDARGRPKILFEPYRFYKNLRKHNPDLVGRALALGLAMTKQPPLSWYGSPDKQYERLARAMVLDETCALMSCSWGLGQVLGENYAMGGWPSVQEMVKACMERESAHLQAMVGYIRNAGLVRAMVQGDADAFGLGYNGKNYRAGGYGTKIKNAWDYWAKQPFPPSKAKVVPMPLVTDVANPAATVVLPAELQPKNQLQSQTVQGLLIAALSLIGGALLKRYIPQAEGPFQQFLVQNADQIGAAAGLLWAYIGRRNTSAPLAGTAGEQKLMRAVADIGAQVKSATAEPEPSLFGGFAADLSPFGDAPMMAGEMLSTHRDLVGVLHGVTLGEVADAGEDVVPVLEMMLYVARNPQGLSQKALPAPSSGADPNEFQ